MKLEKLENSNNILKPNTNLKLKEIIAILKYPELINTRESTPEIELKRENMAIWETITEILNKHGKDYFKIYMGSISLETNDKYDIKYRRSVRGNRLWEVTYKVGRKSINVWFQTIIFKEEMAVSCVINFNPAKMPIDKKIELLKQFHNLLKPAL